MTTTDVGSSVLLSMGNGSGIDILKLARDLTDAEQLPQQSRIETAQGKTEAAISSYAILKYNVELLKEQFNGLNDAQELATPVATSNNTSAVSVSATLGSALSGSHEIAVTQLAAAQRNKSSEFSASSQSLNSGSGFDISVASNGKTHTISIGAGLDTPSGIAAAINASGTGFTATLVDTDTDGNNYRLVIQGPSGEDNAFTVSSTPNLGFHASGNQLTTAANARFTVDGIAIERASNTVSDAITGITLNLNAVASGISLQVVSDTSTLKTKLQDLVSVYNDMQVALTELGDPDSDEEEVGGALSNDLSLLRTVRDAMYDAISTVSSTPSGGVNSLMDLGIELTRTGTLSFNESTYDTVALNKFSDIVTMLSAGTTNQSAFSSDKQGLAFDAKVKLDTLMDAYDGIFVIRESSAADKLTDYEDRLSKIEMRMEMVYQSYVRQFSAMETLINTLNGTREYVKGQLESIANIGKDT
ncbi:flagellar filament capping protein FliD [Pseudomonadales bacterium]|jgi:flagellar hook-associated protein 2|nr:flagellar filament capping protein FliD [Pseudomonadales bacterium]MDC3364709.1 flagellar filament capping protein FliD [Pseudomonadales bacterium]